MKELFFKALIENTSLGGTFWVHHRIGENPIKDPVHEKIIVKDLQYIGIKDRFGIKIFEADIVRWPTLFKSECVVHYDNEEACFVRKNLYTSEEHRLRAGAEWIVVGNIFINYPQKKFDRFRKIFKI